MPKVASDDDSTSVKTSVRIALTKQLRDAFDLIKKTRYPFMKEDEILKIALSQLYASEYIVSSKMTTISTILAKLRSVNSEFGKKWLKEKNINDEDITPEIFCTMLSDLIKISQD
jgi:hypothetical protein